MDTNAPERTLHAPHDAAAAHMISRRSAPCFRRGESAAFDRIRTAIVRHRRGTAPDPRPRSGCTPGLSCTADARGCTELGSRAKPGLGPRRSPQSAVSHGRRTKCRFAIAQRSRGASARLRRCARERPQPRAAAGCKMPFMAMSLVPMGLNLEGSLRRRASKLPPSTNADEARAGCQYASAIRPMSSAHNAAEPRSWCQKLCTLMPTSVGNADGHRDYH